MGKKESGKLSSLMIEFSTLSYVDFKFSISKRWCSQDEIIEANQSNALFDYQQS